MTVEWLFAYLMTSVIVSLSPGADAINSMTTSVSHGYRGAITAIAGHAYGQAQSVISGQHDSPLY